MRRLFIEGGKGGNVPRAQTQVLGVTLLLVSCVARDARVAGAPTPTESSVPVQVAAQPSAAPLDDAFAVNVRPILSRTCAPCHNPGGVMYARMPFDQPQTIRDHAAGVLRRLKGADHDAVSAWLSRTD